MNDLTDEEKEQLEEIIEDLQAEPIVHPEIDVLSIVLRKGSPLHKLWQKLHLKKYPGNY